MMFRFSAPLFVLLFVATSSVCNAFVSPIGNAIAKSVISHHGTIINPSKQLEHCHPIGMQSAKRMRTFIASKLDESEDDDEESVDKIVSGEISEEEGDVSMLSQVTLGIFKLFSYCIQFLGAFFFLGLIANLCGYGYTFDFEHGLVVDKIQNIRNNVQFEMEMEREERQDLKGISGSASSRYLIAPSVPVESGNGVSSIGNQ